MIRDLLLKIYRIIKDCLRWWWRFGIAITLFCLFFITFVPASVINVNDVWTNLTYLTMPHHFDFITWELSALWAKGDALLYGQSAYMTEVSRSDYVRTYMADLTQIQSLEAQIARIYIDPSIDDPISDAYDLQVERDTLRANLETRQTTVEAILEGQVAAVLVDEGFGFMGQLLPPIAMRFTRMPNLLALSPRDMIRLEKTIVIDPMSIDERSLLEDSVMQSYDVSAIIVPLGGIALYPAMINESSNLPYVIETFAHEWVHHYLYFHPLGLSNLLGDGYSGDARTINETTADLFGKEIAALVIARYYPELTPPPLPNYEPNTSALIVNDPEPDAFDFATEMHETRVTVDDYLESAEADIAEAYMEERRIFFFENGYSLRRINQAFFAFYGGYQAGGGMVGAGGADPIGPSILSIRQNSDSILSFIQTMQDITTREQLFDIQENRLLEN